MKKLLLIVWLLGASGALAADASKPAEKAKTARVTLQTESGAVNYDQCEVKRAEPGFVVFVTHKGTARRTAGMTAAVWQNAGKEITHSGSYTITPD
jgi:hypothetical protein